MIAKLQKTKYIILSSLLFGFVITWIFKEEITPWLFWGKSFEARSLWVKVGILGLYIFITASFFLALNSLIGQTLNKQWNIINKNLELFLESIRFLILKQYAFSFTELLKNTEKWIVINSSMFLVYLKGHVNLIIALVAVAVFAYGFELFNLNITIDEEYYSFITKPAIQWVAQARWGMYLLNKFILPYNIIPFAPLSLAITFHIMAVMMLMNSWEVKSQLQQFIIGAICVAFPSTAFMYTFSTLNYGIGIGLFCVAATLFIYSRGVGGQRFFAIIPATFAIAIYQAFLLPLIIVFLFYIVSRDTHLNRRMLKQLLEIISLFFFAIVLYYLIHRLFLSFYSLSLSTYIVQRFDFETLRHNPEIVWGRYWRMLYSVYTGDKLVFAMRIPALSTLLGVAILGFLIKLFQSKSSSINIAFSILSVLLIFLLPFVGGFLTTGYYEMRFLLGLPIVISGVVMLGMSNKSALYKFLLSILSLLCIFQFTLVTNHLFGSSHLALQTDRLLAANLIERIQNVQGKVATTTEELIYMEIIGTSGRPESELVPKISTFGASFFEWDQGDSSRPLAFMRTLGYEDLKPLPVDRRIQLIPTASLMPIWPDEDSVIIVGDTVLIKFGDYSRGQKALICNYFQGNVPKDYRKFCYD